MSNCTSLNEDVSCVLCGAAGQGIQTIEKILPSLLKKAGFNVFATKEYMSRVRGGSNSTEIRVSSGRISASLERIDILVPLDRDAVPHLAERISPQTLIIGDSGKLQSGYNILDIPFSGIAIEAGGRIYENVIATGVLSALFGLEARVAEEYLKEFFAGKSGEVIENNVRAFGKGYTAGEELVRSGRVRISIKSNPAVSDELLLDGREAVGLGALAGGCNFISAYPMTPSTGVLTFLAQHQDDFGIIAEQTEDEISAINMMLGAWYAGGRAMVATSGGGFDLMTEGVSLAGMIESPAVINIGQRPGPATGLPTRTGQEDLDLALHSGHGEFPRIIYAPGTVQDAFFLTANAFDMADKYQVPVFILTDQFLIDSLYNVPGLDLSRIDFKNHFVEAGSDYKRYRFTETGISPRGIPGFGVGLIGLDSDEHDEDGHITEDLKIRTAMVDKRLRKLDQIKKDVLEPELIGNADYDTLIIGWGSTRSAIMEAVERAGRSDIAFLHFRQVYPLYPDTARLLEKAKRTIIVENNATSQFAGLIKRHTGIEIGEKMNKYNGMPFSVEEITERLG